MSIVIPGTKPTQAKAPPLSVGPATGIALNLETIITVDPSTM